jgi:hypothetical protein
MPEWNAVCIFCEDIREENNGETLLGVFKDNLAVPPPPGFVGKIGVFVRVNVPVTSKAGDISVRLTTIDGKDMPIGTFAEIDVKNTLAESAKRGAPLSGFIFRGVASPFLVPQYGRVNVYTKMGAEEILCGTLNFVPTPHSSATASAQPTSQSPSASLAKA